MIKGELLMDQLIFGGEFYFCQFLGKSIVDNGGRRIGKVLDLAVRWGESGPVATCIKFAQGFQSHIDVSLVAELTDSRLVINTSLQEITARALREEEIYVSKWLMDKQIIDRTGAKLVRVNDIKLAWKPNDIILMAVDIGVRGLFRRLGIEFLVKKYPDKFVDWQFITPLENKIANLKLRREYSELRSIHPADMADIIEEMDSNVRRELIANMDDATAADALTEVDLETQVQIISDLDEERASDILEEMPPDEAADILGALSEDKSTQLLSKMDAEDAEDVRELMSYEEDVAGSLMTTEFIVFPSEITAGETIDRLRELSPEAETIYYVYVVDENSRLRGVCSLRELILAKSDAVLGDFIHSRMISVRDTDERQEVFDTILKYNLLAVPVVDDVGRMLGIVTVDDVLHAVMKTRSKLKTFSHYMLASRKEEV